MTHRHDTCDTCGATLSSGHVCDQEDVALMDSIKRTRRMQDDTRGVSFSPSYAQRLSIGFAMLDDDEANNVIL